MAKIALYRKYRPNDFSEVEGQGHVVKTLQNAVKSGEFSHAYIFCGPRGIGKTTIARVLAKAVNCKDLTKDGNPCNKCSSCVSINEQTALDVMEIDAASNRGIDEIRDLREKVKFSPSELKYKVFIIDEVHMLTREAFNALLKTLEEPPAHALFIMATTEIHKIPATVISRCQRFDFKKISNKELEKRISEIAKTEKIKIDAKAVSLIAKASEGGLRDAISIFDQVSMNAKNAEISEEAVSGILGFADISKIRELAGLIDSKNKKQSLDLFEKMIASGTDISQLTKGLLDYYRSEIKSNLETDKVGAFVYFVETLSECNKTFKHSLHPQLALEVAIIKMIDLGKPTIISESASNIPKAEPNKKESGSAKTTPDKEKEVKTENHEVSNSWKQVLYEIKLKNNSIHAFVKESEPIFKGDEIQLVFPYKFHKERIEDGRNKAIVEKAITKVCGKEYKIVCLLEGRSGKKKQIEEKKEEKATEEDLLSVLGGEVIG